MGIRGIFKKDLCTVIKSTKEGPFPITNLFKVFVSNPIVTFIRMSSCSPFPEVEPYEPVESSIVFSSHDAFMIVRPSGNHRVESANEIDSRSAPMSNYA